MKRSRRFVAAMLALLAAPVVSLNAQPAVLVNETHMRAANPAVLEKNYVVCLKDPIDGVVESATANVIKVKLTMPDKPFAKIGSVLRDLIIDGRTPAIRYKAYLASAVFDDVKLFQGSPCTTCETPEQLFHAISERLQETMLSCR